MLSSVLSGLRGFVCYLVCVALGTAESTLPLVGAKAHQRDFCLRARALSSCLLMIKIVRR